LGYSSTVDALQLILWTTKKEASLASRISHESVLLLPMVLGIDAPPTNHFSKTFGKSRAQEPAPQIKVIEITNQDRRLFLPNMHSEFTRHQIITKRTKAQKNKRTNMMSTSISICTRRLHLHKRYLSSLALKKHNEYYETPQNAKGAFESAPAEPNIDALLPKTNMNLVTSINQTLARILEKDSSTILFGQDISFGGVFRCTINLQNKYGKDRVFNTPLNENGIVGMAVGYASTGSLAIAEIQFADYVFPAFDQIKNEASMFRYRSGNQWNCGKMIVRMPYGAVGHGGHYHSQSPEAFFTHIPGIIVMIPRGPVQAKGMLLSASTSNDPVIFFEPKALYRSKLDDVPDEDYFIPIGKAEIMKEGKDVTVVGWGRQLQVLEKACELAWKNHGISCELIDLRTLAPWDVDTVEASVRKTGKLLVSHESPVTGGVGGEIACAIQERCFLSLEAPIARVCGLDIPFPLAKEKEYLPDEWKNLEAIKKLVEYSK